MKVPQSVATILKEHVTLKIEGVDRLDLNVYVPKLQREEGVVAFLRYHRGAVFASSALMDPISRAFVAAMERFAKEQDVPLLTFERGQRKDDVAAEYRAVHERRRGAVHRQGPGESDGVSHGEAQASPDGKDLSLDRTLDGSGQPVRRLRH